MDSLLLPIVCNTNSYFILPYDEHIIRFGFLLLFIIVMMFALLMQSSASLCFLILLHIPFIYLHTHRHHSHIYAHLFSRIRSYMSNNDFVYSYSNTVCVCTIVQEHRYALSVALQTITSSYIYFS